MFWLQGAVSFLIWILYGIGLRRRTERTVARVESWSRNTRAAVGAACLILSGVLLLAGLAALRTLAGPQPSDGLETVPWIAVTLLGIAFVELQVLGATIMVSLAKPTSVSKRGPGASNPWRGSRWRPIATYREGHWISKRKDRRR
ncbi:MAG TPA: hypothetical protein DER07_10680 [Armatimonadetes bacterium]|nr:hypothetical protein [Armatimonadota bacterium]